MNNRRLEIETLSLPALAAVPLYFSGAVTPAVLVVFHAVLLAMIANVARGRTAAILPEMVMKAVAVASIPLYFIDAAVNHAIAASTHLVLFIALYQPIEATRRDNRPQRLLTAALIFTASVATSTHITIVLFVIAFAFLMFRQLMELSRVETARSTARHYETAPSSRTAAFYLGGTTILAALLFPVIPRVRNPLVHGVTGTLTNATTGLSNNIDFNQDRTSTPDPAVVARVWMRQEAIPFFTPLRLRGTVYDRYVANRWEQTRIGFRPIPYDGSYRIARPHGFTRPATVQQRFVSQNKMFLPTGTYLVGGVPALAEGPTRDAYVTFLPPRDAITYTVAMALNPEPLRVRQPMVVSYPITPAVAAMAQSIVGNATSAEEKGRLIESYLLTHFRYVQRPEDIGHRMTVDQFLLRDRRGHCEYFAAGMVALMSAAGVPARIVGGFYGGTLNPLTGYFIIRREDAHAWVEAWTGSRWETFDPTPPSMRPGNAHDGLLRTYLAAISDSVNYVWDRYVLTYGLGDQIALIAQVIAQARDALFRSRTLVHTARVHITMARVLDVAGGIVALVALIAILRWRRRSLFEVLSAELALLDVVVGPGMTMEEALAELRLRRPDVAERLVPIIALYEAERFSGATDPQRARTLRRAIAEWRGRIQSSAVSRGSSQA